MEVLLFIQGKRDYLDVMSRHLEIHATVSGAEVGVETQHPHMVVCHLLTAVV